MPRTYLHADARCRQLERLVRQRPGATVGMLAEMSGLAYHSAKAYMRRLVREQRVEVVHEEPVTPRGSTQRFYPPGYLVELPAVSPATPTTAATG